MKFSSSRSPFPRLRAFAVSALVALVFALLPFSHVHAAATRVTGQVLDSETLQPLAGAEIELQNSGGGPGYFRAKSDAKGEFVLENVATSRYYLFTVGRDGYSDWAIEGWQFPASQRDVRLVVPLERAGVVRVKVTAAEGGKPVAGARVNVRNERARQWWENGSRDPDARFTSASGEVEFSGLTAGYWTVAVEASGLRGDEARRVNVRRGETTPIALALTRAASLAGSVRLADSTGVAGVSVIARGPGEATATTDAAGYWSMGDLAPGRWRVDVQHDGLQNTPGRDGIVLREGESRELPLFKVAPQPAAFSFVMQREVFAPDEKQTVGLRAFRVGQVEMSIWRLPVARLLDPARDFRTAYVQGADTTGLERVERWTHRVDDGPPFSWRETEMALPHELPAGVYVLEGRAGNIRRRVAFFVSDLGLVVKRSPARTVVWAGSLKTGLPLGDVAVFTVAAGRGSDELTAGRAWSDILASARSRRMATDADGLASIATDAANTRVRIVAISEKHGVSIAESPLSGEAQQGGDQLFLFTERPIYRPGQSVFWKLFARDAAGQGWSVPAPADVTLQLAGPDGATLEVGGAKLSASGAADGKLDLPADIALGDWVLSARTGRASGAATVAVQQYRKPEYKVEVTPDRGVYVNGDEVRFKIAATYFFGAPVVGATVRYTLFESRIRDTEAEVSQWGEEGGDDGDGSGSGYGRLLESGETRTDVDGRVSVAFTPQRVAYDRRLSLEVEVVDGAQRVVASRGSAVVGRGLFRIELTPLRGVFKAGAPLVVDVVTKDHEGKPVAAAVVLDLDQDVWNPLERRYTRSSRPLASVTAQTSVLRGFVRVTLSPSVARAGWLRLRAHADDARGNRIGAETSLWVYDDKVWSYGYRYPSLEAIADRDTFAPGDTASILVNTDVKDASVLVSVEGREMRDVRVQHLFGGTGLVRVPLGSADAPNVFVAIHVRRGREVHSRVLELAVRGARHDLAITLTPDKAQYRPRDEASWTVETRDGAGQPVSAEVALGVVDEAIYSLRADGTPDPHDIFYGRRPNWVTTVVSFPTLYYAGADKGDRGDVRRDFRDVAAWEPSVRTGADGRALVKLRWPDNLTTWRATARGMTSATLVGAAVARTRVTKDLVSRLAVPRHFVAGDEATLTSIVTNRTAAPLTGVAEALTVTGAAKLTGAATATSNLPANGESRTQWAVAAAPESPRDGSDAAATFLFRAKGKTDSDALEQPVPVRPRAVALSSSGAGALRAASQAIPVTLPADLVRTGSDVRIELSPSPAALALAGIEHLAAYEYGCTEQTASIVTPALALFAATKAAGVAVPGWSDPVARLTPAIQRLVALQLDGGGWSWWRSGEADPYLSALALGTLTRAAIADVQHDAAIGAINQAQWVMPRLMSEVRSADGEAYCAMQLSPLVALGDDAQGMDDLVALPALLARSAYDQREQLGAAGLACAAITMARLGQKAEAATLLALLAKRGVAGPGGLMFPPDDPQAWYGDALGNTALALEAFATVAPSDPRGDEIVRALAARRTGRGWRNTYATGQIVTALGRWLESHPEQLKGGATARVTWNGEALHDGPVGSTTAFGAGVSLRVPGGKLNPGANTLAISRGEGAAPLHWAWSARVNVPSPGPLTTNAKLQVKREYFRAERTADRRGRPRWLTSPLDPKAPVRVGETILVRITLGAPAPLERLIVEDPRPAGFEIDQLLPAGVDRPWSLAAEARDDRAVFFVSEIESGDTVIEYLLRPEVAGAWTALPVSSGSMYDPDLLVRGAEARLRIVP